MQVSFLEQLPSELLLHLLSFLNLESLLSLSRTSKSFHSLIESTLLPQYALNVLNYSPRTLKHLHDRNEWRWSKRSIWAERVGDRWRRKEFTGVSFGSWERGMPQVTMWSGGGREGGETGVLIARGTGLEWWVAVNERGRMNCVQVVVKGIDDSTFDRSRTSRSSRTSAYDEITAMTAGGKGGQVVVSRASGIVQMLQVVELGGRGRPIVLEEVARYSIPSTGHQRPGSTTIQALQQTSNILASASTTRLPPPDPRRVALDDENDSLAHTLAKRAAPKQHQVTLHSITSPWQPPSVIPLSTKPWSVQLAPGSNRPDWLAIGHSGVQPLTLYPIDSTGSPVISASIELARTKKSTSVYSLTTPSIDCSPFLHPDQTLIAAFFDSTTRIYDLRISSRCNTSSTSLVPSSSNWDEDLSNGNEILRLVDPWSDDPSYSVTTGGPNGSYVAVGSARNSAVRLFDIRQSTKPTKTFQQRDDDDRSGGGGRVESKGITAFSPSGERSPVYGLTMEHSRIWGVTERRGFVFNFHAEEDRGFGGFGGRGGGGGGEERVAFVKHEGEGKGELRKTGARGIVDVLD